MTKTPEQVVRDLAAKSEPEAIDRVDRQFADKLERIEHEGHASGEMIDRLREMWAMLKAPDDIVPWKSKALIMAALSYFVSPFDLIPDVAGKAGYFDDAQVVRIVWNKIQLAVEAFRSAR